MYNHIREEAKKLGYRVGSFDRRMGVTSIRYNSKEVVLKVDQVGSATGFLLEDDLKGFFRV